MNQKPAVSLNRDYMPTLPAALVIGDGQSGLLSAKALTDIGIAVTMVKTRPDGRTLHCSAPDFDRQGFEKSLRSVLQEVELVEPQGAVSMRRMGDDFEVRFGARNVRTFGCVFFTSGADMTTVPSDLPEGVAAVSPDRVPAPGTKVAFLLDYISPSSPAAGLTAIRQAIDNAASGGASFVIMKHAPVAHLFGEALYEDAKRAGVEFYRFGETLPTVRPRPTDPSKDSGMCISVVDVVEHGDPVTLEVDRLFYAGAPDASSVMPLAKEVLVNDVDEEGFLLSSSVHCHSGRSFANGVFAVGECTGELDLIRTAAQAAAAAARARSWMVRACARKEAEAVRFTDACIRCMTCLRLCPHNAISFVAGAGRSTVTASAAACEECGVCVSECPRLVLDLVFFPEAAIESFVDEASRIHGSRPVAVYGCQRSPGRAASRIGLPPDVLFLTVPCAGRISESVLWATMAAGVQGILVVGCHHGNCASNNGTDWAEARVTAALEKLGVPTGMQPPVQYASVAANEEARFSRIVRDFCRAVRGETT
ncbi:MAG: hydrogenase iron-sulfur subunit [Desulfomonilaceae bacterium]|nr:hydrogenase iron-sulfur subunit [Desulfomonilaceae bacterium]